MTKEEYRKYGINDREFAELWLRKFYPNRKQTKVIDLWQEYEDLTVCYNRKIDGYDSNHFEYSYIVKFMYAISCLEPAKQ